MYPDSRTLQRAVLMSVFVAAQAQLPAGQQPSSPAESVSKTYISYHDAGAALDTWRDDLPSELQALPANDREAAWSGWVRERDARIRARLERGDEDSLVNLWLYGTTFTTRPRAVEPEMTRLGDGTTPAGILMGRLDDLIDGIARPGSNDRLQFARDDVERRGMSPLTPEGRARIRAWLIDARQRALEEHREQQRELASTQSSDDPSGALSVQATLFRDRGLSSDTSLLSSFAVEQALRAMAGDRTLRPGSVRHVGIIGPGLDFTNKADGHDFYPQQSIQPFAVIDALIRLRLTEPQRLRVTTLDLSPRVNQHIESARQRAWRDEGYVLHLPLHGVGRWRPELRQYRDTLGDAIGEAVSAVDAPWSAGEVTVRALRVRPSVVLSIVPRDVNIVVERLLVPDEDRFDLIVATNILVYYDAFEQALLMTNAATMLRPGGVLVTNSAVFPTPPFQPTASHLFVVHSDQQNDHVFWYQREEQ